MKRTAVFFLLVIWLPFPPHSLFAQGLSTPQEEVWRVVERSWQAWERRDVDAYMDFLHPEFYQWQFFGKGLDDRTAFRSLLMSIDSFESLLSYELEPTQIVVAGDAAVVHYISHERIVANQPWLFPSDTLLQEGDSVTFSIRWSFFLAKDTGRWRILSYFRDSNCSLFERWPVQCF